ncbi:alpha/beta hydrolase-fold protein [Pelagicoccus sp. SDUM812003]|uniref:alpha/beta hydrolase n=1 Tax=Pelagicoccus sp. SDUM812003 TaxID=3041267 RepID=UPI0028103B41|nr:alpha/beta hydrolase-fold protein [Pelagicoccus sp. SDUM812003]MDQ8204392.1 alpha/beta hydrolase-fold protein [Pelagicoccus sp. SDUM812003]
MKTLTLLFASLLAAVVSAQDHFDVPKRTQFIELSSEITGMDYEIMILLPTSYEASPDASYPVLYLTDAQWDMTLVNSIVGKLNYDKSLVELVLVGISYQGADADYDDLRMQDLSPSQVGQFHSKSGGAGRFLAFLEETLIPTVEARYRIDPEKRALGGVSMGGLFTLYAMYEKPELFDRFISISPATVWDDGYIFRKDEAFAQSGAPLPVRLFLSYGGGEYSAYSEPIAKFQTVLMQRAYEDFALLNWTMEGERHGGVAAEGWTRGLRWAFRDITPYRPGPMEELLAGSAAGQDE